MASASRAVMIGSVTSVKFPREGRLLPFGRGMSRAFGMPEAMRCAEEKGIVRESLLWRTTVGTLIAPRSTSWSSTPSTMSANHSPDIVQR